METLFTDPYIDIDEWRDAPERHRYVHGGFTGSDLRFSIYFPPAEKYQGRFFHPVMHIAGNEHGFAGRLAGFDGDTLSFAFASGGYMVESNMGSLTMAGPEDITMYRASAAAAQYGRQLAIEMYGGSRPYGYVYGGSGGGYKSIACAERTEGVWDGAVPFIFATPVAMPNVFTVQAQALRILDGKFEGIIDALDPGGSGDMYAGLNAEQCAALTEVTKMGFPPRAWFAHERISIGYTGVLASIIYYLLNGDPTYVADFWTKPGYLGANPPADLREARIQQRTTLADVITTAQARELGIPVSIAAGTRPEAPSALRLKDLPKKRLIGSYITVHSGAAAGQKVMVTGVTKDLVMIGFNDLQIPALAQMKPGDELEIDNSTYLAAQYFHRHQLPPEEFYAWDQFRNADGGPMYTQRPLLPSYGAQEVRDRFQSGKFTCKMLVMECLMDEAAYPWQADWYRTKVTENLGDRTDDNFRLWYVDHAMHVSPESYLEIGEGGAVNTGHSAVETRIITYGGVLQQALRDVAAWAERGIAPPRTTHYRVEDTQVIVPESAAERLGPQPTLTVTANGAARIDVRVGEAVSFSGVIEAAPDTGSVVGAEWDFDGSGAYAVKSQLGAAPQVTVTQSHAFQKPGTYFPALRAIVQREDAVGTPFARVQNLGRVRVVVV